MTAPPPRARRTRARRPPAPLWKRALLALGSLLVTLLLLEGGARLALAPPTPVRLREGIYVSQLPLVTGRDTVPRQEGEPLATEKRAGEVRVFVFGESSVEGGPWGYVASPVTMLRDQLHASFPGVDLTIVNMGRGASTAMDSYYHLLTIERFHPDVVVFYLGGNDFFSTDRERCLPSRHPLVHGAFRALVERSRLLWTLRAIGPVVVARVSGASTRAGSASGVIEEELCDPDAGFQAWSDVLVDTAQRMGARIVVASPTQNPLRWAENGGRQGIAQRLDLGAKSDAYRRLLACVLTDGCDLPAEWAREQAVTPLRSPWREARRDAWIRSARRVDAAFIDVGEDFDAHADGGLRPALFADEVHLTIEGYWRLAWLWSRPLGEVIGGAREGVDRAAPPPLDRARYLAAVRRRLRGPPACFQLATGDLYLRSNMPLIAAVALTEAAGFEAQSASEPARSRAGLTAQLLLGSLRRDLGLPPALPREIASQLAGFDRVAIARALAEHPDCSTVGGADLPVGPEEPMEDDPRPFMIPGGQDALLVAMLGVGVTSSDGCRLDRASVPGSHVEAAYRCPDGRTMAVTLHHPSTLLPALVTTERFLIRAGDPPPSAPLIEAISRSVRASEAGFVWRRDGAPQTEPERPTTRAPRPARRGWLVTLPIVVALFVLGIVARRRRKAR